MVASSRVSQTCPSKGLPRRTSSTKSRTAPCVTNTSLRAARGGNWRWRPRNTPRADGRPEHLAGHERRVPGVVALAEDLGEGAAGVGSHGPGGDECPRDRRRSPREGHGDSVHRADRWLPPPRYPVGMTAPDHVVNVSVVIPVYSGEATLPSLIAEIVPTARGVPDPRGALVPRQRGRPGVGPRITAPASSASVSWRDKYDWVRPVWLSRNFGQHPATLAGMSSSGGEWIVTMDEDGQHDPSYIGALLDRAYETRSQLVYAAPDQRPAARLPAQHRLGVRQVDVQVARRRLGPRVVQLLPDSSSARWAAAPPPTPAPASTSTSPSPGSSPTSRTCPIPMRSEGRPASNYSIRKLVSHFGRLVISSGTRPLALVSLIGLVFLGLGRPVLGVGARQPAARRLRPAGLDVHLRVDPHRRRPHAVLARRHRAVHPRGDEHVPRQAALRRRARSGHRVLGRGEP